MIISSSILFDTNILIYSLDAKSPYHNKAVNWRNKVETQKIAGVLSTQNLAEFSRVLLDSKQSNLLLMSSKIISEEIARYRNSQSGFSIIYPNSKSLDIFEKLIVSFHPQAKSQRIFDVFLVATMLGNNIFSILTANAKDFSPFPQIKVIRVSSPKPAPAAPAPSDGKVL